MDRKIDLLNTLVNGINGKWDNNLKSGTDAYDSKLDTLSHYMYISGDSICGLDTADLFIKRSIGIVPLNIDIDTVLCFKDSLALANKIFKDSGKYTLVIPSVTGCDSIVYSLHLSIDTMSIHILQGKELCDGDSISLSIDPGFNSIKWTNSSNNTFGTLPKSIISIPGQYIVTASSKHMCVSSDTIDIKSNPKPKINSRDMINIEYIKDTPLDVNYVGPISKFNWTPPTGLSCHDCAVPKLVSDMDNKYFILITTAQGCMSLDSITVTFLKRKYFFPNAISMKSLNENKFFFLRSNISIPYDLDIFDRWGHVVYSHKNLVTNDLASAWDPDVTRSPAAVYVYKAVLHTGRGDELKAGDVTVLR
jgi:hypothetical protein